MLSRGGLLGQGVHTAVFYARVEAARQSEIILTGQ